MNPLGWLSLWRGVELTEAQRRRRDALPVPQAVDNTPLDAVRFVVVDLETSGLDTQRDQLLSIGAVVIEQRAIDLTCQFERTLKRDDPPVNESTLIHGIAPSELARGTAADDALLDFFEFAGSCVFAAFHAPFDQRMLVRSSREELGRRLRHTFIDVAELAPLLVPEAKLADGKLDDWQAYFGLSNEQRHHAAADALATAQIMLILLSRAHAQGIRTLDELVARLHSRRSLRRTQAKM